MRILNFHCEVCREKIGRIDADAIKLPLTPFQFMPLSDDPDCPPPFPYHDGLEWQYFQCPVCKKRPFLDPHKLFLGDGDLYIEDKQEPVEPETPEQEEETPVVPEPEPPTSVCPECGKVLKNQSGLYLHMRSHKIKR